MPPEPLADSAKIIREFFEDYHEKLEENFLFPRFRKPNKLVDLVDVLLQQHQAGRRLTDITMHLATNQAFKNADDRRKLADSMRQFIRMYSPYEAREDTVLFPAFHGIVSAHEFDSLGEDFEKKSCAKKSVEMCMTLIFSQSSSASRSVYDAPSRRVHSGLLPLREQRRRHCRARSLTPPERRAGCSFSETPSSTETFRRATNDCGCIGRDRNESARKARLRESLGGVLHQRSGSKNSVGWPQRWR